MPDKYQYFVSNGLETKQTFPLGKPKIVWQKNEEDYRRGYPVKISGDISFRNDAKNSIDDFDWFYTIETGITRCEFVDLSILQLCGGTYVDAWQGRISMNAGDWNIDKCIVSFTVDDSNKYNCYEDEKDTEINLFEVITSGEAVNLFRGDPEYTSCVVGGDSPSETPCPPEGEEGWTLYRFSDLSILADNPHVERFYVRFNFFGDYFPALVFFPFTVEPFGPGTTDITYNIAGVGNSGIIDNGFILRDVFQALLDTVCPGLTIQSEFFQWNSLAPTTINYVTGEESKILNLKLFQKSDVRRPFQYSNASIAMVNLHDLLVDVCTMFWLRWDIDEINNYFIIEHVSFWGTAPGLDTTQERYQKFMRGKNAYSYKRDEMPAEEIFHFAESENNDFTNHSIVYKSSCVNPKSKKEYNVDIISTDVKFCLDNPAASNDPNYSPQISDDGFVLIACDSDDNIQTLPGILDQDSVNNVLSWSYLLQDFHKHSRILLDGEMNGVDTSFVSVKKTKIQKDIAVPLCCEDDFDPIDLITTAVGMDGEVQSATLDLQKEILSLELAFTQ